MKLYTLDNQFIKETGEWPSNFTGLIIWDSGSKEWRSEGKLHRLDGHAYETVNGTKYWFVNEKQVTEQQHNLLVGIMKLKGLI